MKDLIEEERKGIKREMRVKEEGGYNIEDDINEELEKKLRDKEIESRKKKYQELKLQLIKEEEYKVELDRSPKEKMEEDRKKQEAKSVRAN
jgi:hypothetical protein